MIIYFLRALVGFLLQTVPPAFLCMYPFWSRLSSERKRPILFFFFTGFLTLGIFIAMIFIDTLKSEHLDSNVNLINLLMLLEQCCCFIIYMLVIRDLFFKKLFCLTFVSSFFAGIALITSFLNRLVFPDIAFGLFVQDGYLWSLPGICLFFLFSALGFFFLFWIMKRMSRYLFDFNQSAFWRNLCILPVLFYLWIFFTPNDLFYGLIIISATLIMLLSEIFIVLFTLETMAMLTASKKDTPKTKTPVLTPNLLSNKTYAILNEKLQRSEIFCHDFKHQLFILKNMMINGDLKEAISYTDALLFEISNAKPLLLSGNYLVDTLLNGHLSELSNRGISIEIQTEIPAILPFDYDELCALLHQLLILATQGCESVPVEEAQLNLNLKLSKDGLSIRCIFPSFSKEDDFFKALEVLLMDGQGRIEFLKNNSDHSEIFIFLIV